MVISLCIFQDLNMWRMIGSASRMAFISSIPPPHKHFNHGFWIPPVLSCGCGIKDQAIYHFNYYVFSLLYVCKLNISNFVKLVNLRSTIMLFIYLLATVFIHLPLFILMSPIFSSGILVWFSMVTFIDDLLSKYLVYFLKEKSNVFSCFNIFQKIALNQLVTLVKIV